MPANFLRYRYFYLLNKINQQIGRYDLPVLSASINCERTKTNFPFNHHDLYRNVIQTQNETKSKASVKSFPR